MAANLLSLQGDIEELKTFFLGLLEEAGFSLVYREESGAGFKMVGANRERVSQLIITLNSLLGGYVPKNRVAVELQARRDGAALSASLRGVNYLDILDIEAREFTQSELEICVRLVSLFSEQLLERFG
jgi:hypothetical protein